MARASIFVPTISTSRTSTSLPHQPQVKRLPSSKRPHTSHMHVQVFMQSGYGHTA